MFKVESPYYNYYARFFKPYVHYIPVKYDLSDLAQQVKRGSEGCVFGRVALMGGILMV